jgi:hypothetical protein
MKINTKSPNLLSLIEDAHKGTLVLPQFQRSFVWAYTDVVDFLLSIFRGYFIGTFLFQDCDKDNIPFDFRTIEGVSIPKDMLLPEKLVLDGQQRITTLHYVLYAPENINLKWTKYPYRFFLDLNKLYEDDLSDDAIFGERVGNEKKYHTQEFQFQNRIIPFTILQSFESWTRWQSDYESWLIKENQEEFLKYSQTAKNIWWKYIYNLLTNITVPVVEIDKIKQGDEKGLSEVCAIFEKMNTTGVKLSVFDLLTARLYKDKIDLRKLWEDSVEEFSLLKEFSESETDTYGVFVLRTIGLIRGVETKSKALINLNSIGFEDDWKIAAKYVEKALNRACFIGDDGFGVFDKYWLPYPPMIPVIAAVLCAIDSQKLGSEAFEVLKRWYWGSVFTEHFQSAVESKTTGDYKNIMKGIINGDFNSDVFQDVYALIVNNPNFTLTKTSRVNSVYKGVMNLLALNGAKDFRLRDNIGLHELDDHHIFPVKYLKDRFGKDISDDRINVVLNKTLIHQSTNRKIGKRSPIDYLNDSEIIGNQPVELVLKSHLMDENTIISLMQDNYDEFITNRDKYVVNIIKHVVEK